MLRATRALSRLNIQRPTLLVDAKRVQRNIAHMARKMGDAGVDFRPHFKTHQSAAIGAWFRDAGVDAVTVSSLDMAEYFADHGWSDITVAFPLNVREIDTVNRLASRITLHLVVDSHAAVEALEARLTHGVYVWIKVDVGGRRSGVPWMDVDGVMSLAHRIVDQPNARMAGLCSRTQATATTSTTCAECAPSTRRASHACPSCVRDCRRRTSPHAFPSGTRRAAASWTTSTASTRCGPGTSCSTTSHRHTSAPAEQTTSP